MGRKRSIDRDKVLDAAETIVVRDGAKGLTIDAVAREMGVTKGGIQYCYGSKDAMIEALFERWDKAYETLFQEVLDEDASPRGRVRAHAEATRRADAASNAKAASLLAALIQAPELLGSTRSWYRSRLDGLDVDTEAGRHARLAVLATEGAFLLRFFGLMEMDESEWQAIFRDIRAVLVDAS
ncbi:MULTISPECIES: TetR/AcrR family transcriptional regulator [Bordetella]|uniref:TetR family transcriptional regulator n=1 Tax=Bordetella genomosp. 6 TaxID=463024 RepID=A0ABX4FH31_9BORD|nr:MULTISPECIES: TetR/AcrR family transcriptional regulator [Bordetella]AOB27661.1 TetR family transcriptional regulator [Bordetella bronchiseptica]AZW44986.1 TetR/AcrR family transcriptional regulator [Bordetella bronchiseptica]KCV64936.1 transcriptional regulator, TetR family [Bordetella bronchiseptica 99-R-0433]OZI81499.1 TetR family transcriptional regulator [Bordetella genomosp. 6]